MARSVRTNFLYSLLSNISGILYPLLTFPYASRILQADGIGQVSFFASIISYVGLFSCLGIPIYAIREIAKIRDDKPKRDSTAIEILLLHLALTLVGYLGVVTICLFVPQVTGDVPLFLILSAELFLNAIGAEWFFVGNEDFKYITLRGLLIRCISVVLLYICVHSKDDILIYAIVLILGTVGNNVFNFIRLGRLISWSDINLKSLCVIRHLYPSLKVFALYAIISLYVNLNSLLLGFMCSNVAVGYYAGATKITQLLLGIVRALQGVLIPRSSYLAKEQIKDAFNLLCQKTVDFVVLLSIPLSVGTVVMAPAVIRLFCGASYAPAITTLTIISPIILLIALSGIPCFQILYPLGHEKEAIWSVATGAVVNLLLCLLLIPVYSYNGAAIAVVACELVVTITMFLFGRKYIHVKRWSVHYMNCVLAGIVMLVTTYGVRVLNLRDWLNILVIPIIGALVYGGILVIRKDEFVLKEIMCKVKI